MKKALYIIIGVTIMMVACKKEEAPKTAADLLAERLESLR